HRASSPPPQGRRESPCFSWESTSIPQLGQRDAVFTLRPDRDGHWYQHFQAEFDRVWEHGRPADASDGFPG
ncbi:hypothetical protein ACFVRU_21930, partial [Streptomyces sp. NPDC057927]